MIFLIGHRGVGKTRLLDDYQVKNKQSQCWDLDHEVEIRNTLKIKELFSQGQVQKFRQLELETLKTIIDDYIVHTQKKNSATTNCKQQLQLVVALGAGFTFELFKFPKDSLILWLRRPSDSQGRIFFDRPALTKNSNPLVEWEQIFDDREKKYAKYANAQVSIPEYFDKDFNPLHEYLNFKAPRSGLVTLLPKENDKLLLRSNCSIELRTDLLTEKQILEILKNKLSQPEQSIQLVALRKKVPTFVASLRHYRKQDQKINKAKKQLLIDWDLELGFPPLAWLDLIDVVSTHSKEFVPEILVFIQELQEKLSLSKQNSKNIKMLKAKLASIHFKICPEVNSHNEAIDMDLELQALFKNLNYSFLPRSNGLFNLTYFRQLKSYQQKINFFRFGEGTSTDQPYWWQWPAKKPKGFFGIWGENIKHSLTPSFHLNYFKNKNMSPLSIDSYEDFMNQSPYFKDKGLAALAVTSPYKLRAYKASGYQGAVLVSKSGALNTKPKFITDKILNFDSANTLILKNKLDSYNTDYLGLDLFLKSHVQDVSKVVVWGGGALLAQLQALLPDAVYFSAQRAKPRNEIDRAKLQQIKDKQVTLIWAGGQKGLNPDQMTEKLTFQKIVDLDYRENSKAKLYSVMSSVEYISGLDFFIQQAKAQQYIWDQYEF